jgi:hypothetical protein
LSLGHMKDLTVDSFAYLRVPLIMAGVAFLLGALGAIRLKKSQTYTRVYLVAALMMVLFFQAARLAMVKFDPLLSSRDFANAILKDPPGQIILDHSYYWFSSIPFYTNRPVLLLNGRWNNLEYGSNAPGAPDVFLDDNKLKTLWSQPQRYYLVARANQTQRFNDLLGEQNIEILGRSGGKLLMTNIACCAASK